MMQPIDADCPGSGACSREGSVQQTLALRLRSSRSAITPPDGPENESSGHCVAVDNVRVAVFDASFRLSSRLSVGKVDSSG